MRLRIVPMMGRLHIVRLQRLRPELFKDILPQIIFIRITEEKNGLLRGTDLEYQRTVIRNIRILSDGIIKCIENGHLQSGNR